MNLAAPNFLLLTDSFWAKGFSVSLNNCGWKGVDVLIGRRNNA